MIGYITTFFNINLLPIIEWTILGVLFLLIYRYLKGTVAHYILFGFGFVFATSLLLCQMGFKILISLFEEVTKYGLLIVLIIFQPELRNLLISIGNNRISREIQRLRKKWFEKEATEKNIAIVQDIIEAIRYLQENKLGASIVMLEEGDYSTILKSGHEIDAKISSKLIESIFQKKSPLHDGAIVIQDGRLKAASCILPISERLDLPERTGLRHKSAVGITEIANAICIVVSEQTSLLSYAKEGKLHYNQSLETIAKKLQDILNAS